MSPRWSLSLDKPFSELLPAGTQIFTSPAKVLFSLSTPCRFPSIYLRPASSSLSPRRPSQESPSRPCSSRSGFAVFSSSFNHRRQLYVEVSSFSILSISSCCNTCGCYAHAGMSLADLFPVPQWCHVASCLLSKSKSLPCRSTPCSITAIILPTPS